MTDVAPPRWDLTPFFAGVDDRSFTDALEGVYAAVSRLEALYDSRSIRATETRDPTSADAATLDEVLDATNELQAQLRTTSAYLHMLTSTDSRNDRAQSLLVELQTRTAPLGPLSKRLDAWVAALGVEALVHLSPTAEAHAFALERASLDAQHQMSEAEESLGAALAPSGAQAWQRLHGDVSSQLMADLHHGGTTQRLSVTAARALAIDPDPGLRRAAYEAELEAWASAAVPLAAAINGAKGQQILLNRRRGFTDDLEPALRVNNVDRATLDAMTDAVVASLPVFRRHLRAKARLFGHHGALPWWDLIAPVGEVRPVSWIDATELVQSAFTGYGTQLGGLAHRAFTEQWVDAEMRDGKRGGAYCINVRGDTSRVMMNFDDSLRGVWTLAHELGHAYHNVTLAPRTPIQRRLPMALAETASIFCEMLLFESSTAHASDDAERLILLDGHLADATQVVVDIHSRFLFETELCRRRARTTLSVNDLNTLMLDAQDRSYGDGLHADFRHPYMWAVKSHYFTPFYNWPYTFGLLFGIGLYAQFVSDPDRFRSGYDDLLSSTGMADAATLGRRFGIDVRDGAFWASSLAVLAGHIDEHERLVNERS